MVADEFAYTSWKKGGYEAGNVDSQGEGAGDDSIVMCPSASFGGEKADIVYLSPEHLEFFLEMKDKIDCKIVLYSSQLRPSG